MLKFIGSVLVICCCTLLGLGATGRTKQRIKALNGLLAALEIMKSELSGMLTPMPELMELLSEEVSAPARDMFAACRRLLNEDGCRSFRESWRRSVLETADLCLLPEEAETLCELGVSLGRYNAEDQCRAIDKAAKRLELFLQLEEKDKAEKGKVNAFIGLGTGVTLAILLF
jgi:stage III sporulation protein AB